MEHADLEAFYGHEVGYPCAALGGFLDGRLVAVAGLAWHDEDRCWIFWRWRNEALLYPVLIMRTARHILAAAREAGEEAVWSSCEPGVDRAERLHRALGFQPAMLDDRQVWKWLIQ